MAGLDGAAALLADAYQDAEMRILARIIDTLRRGLAASDFELFMLGQQQRLRIEALAALGQVNATLAAELQALISEAYSGGAAATLADVGLALHPVEVATYQKRAAVALLVDEIHAGVTGAQGAVLRQLDDSYRRVVAKVVATTVTGGRFRLDSAQHAVNELFGKGLTTFPDKGGRAWRLPDYVEMAVRTGNRQAMIRGHEAALDANHLDLVVVQPGPRACGVCDKWARLVLARSGQPGDQQMRNLLNDEPMQVTVHDTLAAARAAGFQHPNCRCRLRAFLPGATKLATLNRPEWDADGYAAQQKQRGLERNIRHAKLSAVTSLDPRAAAAGRQAVLVQQARMRAHMAAHPKLKRQSAREQVSGRFATPAERQLNATGGA